MALIGGMYKHFGLFAVLTGPINYDIMAQLPRLATEPAAARTINGCPPPPPRVGAHPAHAPRDELSACPPRRAPVIYTNFNDDIGGPPGGALATSAVPTPGQKPDQITGRLLREVLEKHGLRASVLESYKNTYSPGASASPTRPDFIVAPFGFQQIWHYKLYFGKPHEYTHRIDMDSAMAAWVWASINKVATEVFAPGRPPQAAAFSERQRKLEQPRRLSANPSPATAMPLCIASLAALSTPGAVSIRGKAEPFRSILVLAIAQQGAQAKAGIAPGKVPAAS